MSTAQHGRQIALDTETTGMPAHDGHRVIEIGCVELVNRRLTGNNFHARLNPDRLIDAGAQQVHGISDQDVVSMPRFSAIADDLWAYLSGAELLIHNAAFDVEFLTQEFSIAGHGAPIHSICSITDTLLLARQKHPGQANSLEALCKRYSVDVSGRTFHGALIDARLLADVYLAMTGGQSALGFVAASQSTSGTTSRLMAALADTRDQPLTIIYADEIEIQAHERRMEDIELIHAAEKRRREAEKEEIAKRKALSSLPAAAPSRTRSKPRP